MAQLDQEFDAEGIAPQESFDLLPVGEYECYVSQSDVRTTKNGNGQYVWLELTISEGEYVGRKLFDRINWRNENPKAQEIGQRQLSGLAHAVGKLKISDTTDVHDIPLIAVVKIEKDKTGQYSDKNIIKAYKPSGGSPQQAATKPPMNRPPQQTQQRQPPKPAAGNGSKPPWAQK